MKRRTLRYWHLTGYLWSLIYGEWKTIPISFEARRELLATAANEFLDQLLLGNVPEAAETGSILEREVEAVVGRISSPEEEKLLINCMSWMDQQGLPLGELEYELVNETTKQLLAVLDLAWPNGIQVRCGQPVALLIDEGDLTFQIAQLHEFRCFVDLDQLRMYVREVVMGYKTAAARQHYRYPNAPPTSKAAFPGCGDIAQGMKRLFNICFTA